MSARTRSIFGIPVPGEEFRSPNEHAGSGGALLAGVDLDVCEPGVTVDHGVDVVESDPFAALLVVAAALFGVGPPAAAVRGAAELFHVNVQKFAGSFALVAVVRDLRGPDLLPSQWIAK